jgi:colanic acid biosynthesis glycosyl transferase WcaI
MKSITLVVPHYQPESTAPARRATETSQYLCQRGWNVTVIAPAPNYPQGQVYEGYGTPWVDVREEAGIRVVRLRPWVVKKSNLAFRFLSEAYFSLFASCWVLFHKAKITFVSCPYMLLGPIVYFATLFRRTSFVWEIRDLTWRYVATTGKRTFGAERLLKSLMLWTARRSDALITTTEGQREYFRARNSAPSTTAVIPNGVSQELMDALDEGLAREQPTRALEALELNVTYIGLLGYPQGLSTVVHAAELVPDVSFHFVGDGADRANLERLVADLQLSNVRFHGFVGFSDVVEHYRNADLLVASLRSDPVFEVTQPSKIWEYMMAGRAIVYSGKGEAANVIQKCNAGIAVPPEDPERLADAIRKLRDNNDLRISLGRNGREFASENLCRDKVLPHLEDTLVGLSKAV